jgi:hypothetical protein
MPVNTRTGVGWYCCASLERADLDARRIAETEAGKLALEFGEQLLQASGPVTSAYLEVAARYERLPATAFRIEEVRRLQPLSAR